MRDLARQVYELKREIERLRTLGEVGRWVNWTPTVDQGGSVAVTVDYARYFYQNGLVHLWVDLTVTGSGTAGQKVQVAGHPYNFAHTVGRVAIGSFVINDGGTYYVGTVDVFDNPSGVVFTVNAAGFVGANPSLALGSGNTISFQATYEAA